MDDELDLESVDPESFDREARRRGYAPREETRTETRAEISAIFYGRMAIDAAKRTSAAEVEYERAKATKRGKRRSPGAARPTG